MASSAKDIQLRELKDTVSQRKTMIAEQTELIKALRLIIDEKTSHEKALQEQVDYLTKKLFGPSSERRSDDIPGQQNLFDEAEVEQDPSLLEGETVIREHTRKKKAAHEELFKGETYLEDGRCSFTNNLSENAIRPFAVGRKNWLFSSSVDGANASAVVYTMVEMAKAHGLNIYGYLKFLLENRPSKNMTDEQLAELAPWSEKLQSIKNRM
jgi:hypothetical protein